MKVKITKQIGQTGLRKLGTIVQVIELTGKHWIKQGWATLVKEPVKEPIKKKTDKTAAKRETKELKDVPKSDK